MSRLNLVIGDSDEAYQESLSGFLINKYSHRFNISSFSKKECLENYLNEENRRVDILLTGFNLELSSINDEVIKCLIFLNENRNENKSCENSDVYKYQQGDKLVGCIMNLFSEKNNCEYTDSGIGKKTRVVSMYSPQGGSGKTCITLSTCIQCSRKGLKVFYLNLEDFNSSSAFLDCTPDASFSNIIYYLKDKNKNLAMKIDALKSIDPIWGIHYFSPPQSDTEINELTSSDLQELISKLSSLKTYDLIFVDMSCNLGEKNSDLLISSDQLVLTLDQGFCSKAKLGRFMSHLEMLIQKDSKDIKNKMSVVINKYKQGMESELESYFRESSVIKIPEIRDFEWDRVSNILKSNNKYLEAINKLVHKCSALN